MRGVVGLVIILGVALFERVRCIVQDKSALYAKYPQLVSSETDPCVRGLNQVLINMRTDANREIMTQTSMHGLNDLGSMHECEHGTMGDLATYTTLKFNLTYIPVQLISGLCLPSECAQQTLTDFSDTVTNKINSLAISLQKRFNLVDLDKGYGLITRESRVTMMVTQSDTATEEWQQSMRVGFYSAATFCTLVILAFFVVPNVAMLIRHFRGSKRQELESQVSSQRDYLNLQKLDS